MSRVPSRIALAVATALVAVAVGPGSSIAGSSRTLFTPTGTASFEQFGTAAAGVGDFNADGWPDVMVGSPYLGLGGTAFLYFGGPNADAVADRTFLGTTSSEQFGQSIAKAGDFNGD